ncbi:ABC transporter ATP-binding protein [Thiothrix nivea]|uniref:ABC transporter related protein n=1 Tax=Thiothrix nivea (strain ATCC 35100 / DSM 5205 / JP2) TaxID=870187 RepID=A0A656HJV4_THINJ|nr:ABC transporter ATP-binding protein [Thiothrix nivea]EIJ35600.1 ABC transporter related protein [Thiothrix nivea DSM 5205]
MSEKFSPGHPPHPTPPPPGGREPFIQLRNICRFFQVGDETVHALDHVTLDIHAGDYISVMGPSGSGKSTLLNMLGLLDQADSGSYRLEGRELTTLPEEQRAQVRREKIGFIFQSFHLIPRLTAAENVELPLVLTGIPANERRPKVQQALTSLGLAERADHRPAQLSGGQQQRVAIARATILQAPLLLADEPTGNLDTHSSTDVIRILEALNTQGITLVIVTHDANIGGRARRAIRMVDGKIVQDGT